MARGEPDAVLGPLTRLDRRLARERIGPADTGWPADEITARHEVEAMVKEAVARAPQESHPELSLSPTHLRLRGLKPWQLLVAVVVIAMLALMLGAIWLGRNAHPHPEAPAAATTSQTGTDAHRRSRRLA
jgi:hypothetical protein